MMHPPDTLVGSVEEAVLDALGEMSMTATYGWLTDGSYDNDDMIRLALVLHILRADNAEVQAIVKKVMV